MFTQSSPAASLGSAAASAVSPTSPTSRAGRLRGLSYLRNYTQTHLLSREHSNTSQQSNSSSASAPASASASTPAAVAAAAVAAAVSITRPNLGISRSAAYSPTPPAAALSTASVNPARSEDSTNPSMPSRASHWSLILDSSPSPTSHAIAQPPQPVPAAAPVPPSGRSAESEVGLQPTSRSNNPAPNAAQTTAASSTSQDLTASMPRGRSVTMPAAPDQSNTPSSNLDIVPSIRFSAYYDPRATRPSLTFTPISRTLPTGAEIIRVGRYSERDNQPNVPANVPSSAPVGFKSKVVSRRHCEFWFEGGKWYIKDVKSSSGTFLNHIRLSPPGTESKPYAVNDGDIVQLGIDFKGGEEMIFRCVKMRLELNRGWQSKLNTFNMATHKHLRNMRSSSSAQTYSQDCSICLSSIAPCQCLFVAPCSHTWHYKCIRSLLAAPQYPIFICPNCRAAADLEAEVEDPGEWQQLESDVEQEGAPLQANANGNASATDQPSLAPPRRSRESERRMPPPISRPPPPPVPQDPDAMEVTMHFDSSGEGDMMLDQADGSSSGNETGAQTPTRASFVSQSATSMPVPIPAPQVPVAGNSIASRTNTHRRDQRTPSPNGNGAMLNGHEGPITPRNDAGPWVFDGSGMRMGLSSGDGAGAGNGSAGGGQIASLDAALPTEGDEGGQVTSLDAVLPGADR